MRKELHEWGELTNFIKSCLCVDIIRNVRAGTMKAVVEMKTNVAKDK